MCYVHTIEDKNKEKYQEKNRKLQPSGRLKMAVQPRRFSFLSLYHFVPLNRDFSHLQTFGVDIPLFRSVYKLSLLFS